GVGPFIVTRVAHKGCLKGHKPSTKLKVTVARVLPAAVQRDVQPTRILTACRRYVQPSRIVHAVRSRIGQEFPLVEMNEFTAKRAVISRVERAVYGPEYLTGGIIGAVVDVGVAQAVAWIPIRIRRHGVLRIDVSVIADPGLLDIVGEIGIESIH